VMWTMVKPFTPPSFNGAALRGGRIASRRPDAASSSSSFNGAALRGGRIELSLSKEAEQ